MRRRQVASLLGGTALASLAGLPALAEPPDGCGAPSARDANIHAVLVARSGKLVFERYLSGSDEVPGLFFGSRVKNVTFDAGTLHDVKSVSKSVASLALGIAIDRGLIRSINEPEVGQHQQFDDCARDSSTRGCRN